jgi:hypothetical protein
VILPKPLFKLIPKSYFSNDNSGALRLLADHEWRGIGIQQSLGWVHYEIHGTSVVPQSHSPEANSPTLRQHLNRMSFCLGGPRTMISNNISSNKLMANQWPERMVGRNDG